MFLYCRNNDYLYILDNGGFPVAIICEIIQNFEVFADYNYFRAGY